MEKKLWRSKTDSGEGDNETAGKEKDLILPEDTGEINLLDGSHSVDR